MPSYIACMFSPKLEGRWRLSSDFGLRPCSRLGIALIVIWAVRASIMLEAADAERAPIIIGVLIALAGLLVLCLIAYGAVRAFGRFPPL